MGLGHRRIVFFNSQPLNGRRDGHYLETFMAEASHLGLKIDPVLQRLCEDRPIDDETYTRAMEQYVGDLLSAGSHRPTAILTRYRFAIGLLDAVQRIGLNVPGDLSLIGIMDRLLHYMHPPITAYDWPMEELGRSAVELLLSRIADPHRPYRTLAVRGRVIERASCGPRPPNPDSILVMKGDRS
jgi:LacI family transcriptional regulator